MTDAEDDADDIRIGKCPRCGTIDHRKAREVSKFAPTAGSEDDDFFALKTCSACGLGGVPRGSVRGGYYLREVREAIDELPTMGRPCLHCGARIPKFLDLSQDAAFAIRRKIHAGGEEAAIALLMEATGCPRAWAKIWVAHPYGPRRPRPQWAGPPCTYCGRPMRSMNARQCVECGMDWHDPDNVRRLGSPEAP